ncbi:MAG: T9SS type A sorting domain-containing protein, partial [Ignavibacterium sp.]
ITINTAVTRTGDVTNNDLLIHLIVVEDVMYNGRNGLSDHKHVMRKMLPSPSGMPFVINLNETKNDKFVFNVDALWDASMLSVVVFIQSAGTMTVYQSETITYSDFTITEVEDKKSVPSEYSLEQNYPNPFNPTTRISYSIPSASSVQLKVYNVLGNEVATIVNKEMPAGNHSVEYNASILPSGIYFYTLTTNHFSETKKMTLIK